MTKVIFYAHFLKCITLNISIKCSTVKAVSLKSQVLGLEDQVLVNITVVLSFTITIRSRHRQTDDKQTDDMTIAECSPKTIIKLVLSVK